MKISLSKPGASGKQHVVLKCDRYEDYRIYSTVMREVLKMRGPYQHRTQSRRNGKVTYRFKMKYLERLMLTFPYAHVSEGVERKLSREAQAEYQRLLMTVPNFEVPGMRGQLYPFQRVGVHVGREHLREHGSFFLNDEMGLGKSLQALAIAVMEGYFPLLVVCPNTIKWIVWERMSKEFFPGLDIQVIDGTAQQRSEQILRRAQMTVINYEALRLQPELQWSYYKCVIADEYHRIKNPRAKLTKAFHGINAEKKIMLSGTPILNGKPEELWSPIHYTFPGYLPRNYYAFESSHIIKQGYKVVGYKGLDKLHTFLKDHSLRRRKEQVLAELPPRLYSTRIVGQTPEERGIYRQIKEDLILWLEDGERKPIPSVLAQVTRLKQACFSPELYGGSRVSSKLVELKELVRELVESGEKAIIFSQWAKAVKIIERELSEYDPAVVTGKVKGRDRMAQVDKFQEDDDCKLFIGTIGACREGITLHAASYVIFTDKGWTPAENEQAAARAHRIGQSRTVNIIELQTQGTIEEHIEERLAAKMRMFNALVERDGGEQSERVTLEDIRELLAA